MSYNRILTIQDISCVGQCSLTVALPILSACGQEAVILPSAVLSTHTGGFTGFTFRDLTDDIPLVTEHWKKEGIKFNAIYTGYLGSLKQISYVKNIFNDFSNDGKCLKIVDPAMADHGKLYSIFDMEYAKEMATLCSEADIVLPNITEACLMTGKEYKESYDESYVKDLLAAMREAGMKTIVLTGVSYDEDSTGVLLYENDDISYYKHKKLKKSSHGTGDIFASALVGSHMSGQALFEACKTASNFVLESMINTQGDESHWYGVKFETALKSLINTL